MHYMTIVHKLWFDGKIPGETIAYGNGNGLSCTAAQ